MRNTLVDSKFVRIMPDHCSSGVWNIRGSNVDEEDLPVTPALITRIKEWQRVFDTTDWYTNSAERTETYREICYENLAIAVEVARQLPDWTVVIYNGGEFDLPRDDRSNSVVTGNIVAKYMSYNNQLQPEDLL